MEIRTKLLTAVQRFLAILRTEKIGGSGGIEGTQTFQGELTTKVIRKKRKK